MVYKAALHRPVPERKHAGAVITVECCQQGALPPFGIVHPDGQKAHQRTAGGKVWKVMHSMKGQKPQETAYPVESFLHILGNQRMFS